MVVRQIIGTPISTFDTGLGANGGTVTVNNDGSFTFDPGSDFDYLLGGASTTATFTYSITDALGNASDTATVTIEVTGVNDAPVVDLNGVSAGADYSATFTEGDLPLNIVDTGVSVTDVDDTTLTQIDITVGGLLDGANEQLTIGTATFALNVDFTGTTTISSVVYDITYTSGTGLITIDRNDSTEMTLAEAQLVLAATSYENTLLGVTTGDRTFAVTVNDGDTDSAVAISTILVTPPNTAPVINDLSGDNATYLIGAGAQVLDISTASTVIDAEENFDGVTTGTGGTLTVNISSGNVPVDDTIAIQNIGTGPGEISVSGANVSYEGTVIGTFTGGGSGADLVITFNGSATSAAIGVLINNITFDYAGVTNGARVIDFTLVDDVNITTDGGAIANDFDNFQENRDATFEIWIRPDDLSSGGDQLIFETGSNNEDGVAIYLDDNNILTFYVHDQGNDSAVTTYNLATDILNTGSNKTNEFIQIVASISMRQPGNTEFITLYVNGTQVDQSGGDRIRDWSSGGDAGLGTVNGSSVATNNGDNPVNFNGEIALFRFYSGNGTDLTAAEVTANFGNVADHLYVSGVDDGAGGFNTINETDPGGTLQSNTGTTTQGGTVVMNSDGSFDYTPPALGTFDYLAVGQTATDTSTYEITDVFGTTDTATVTITITGVQNATDPDSGDTITYTIDSDSLPSGLIFTNGVLGGTAAAAASSTITVLATDAEGATTTYDVLVNVTATATTLEEVIPDEIFNQESSDNGNSSPNYESSGLTVDGEEVLEAVADANNDNFSTIA